MTNTLVPHSESKPTTEHAVRSTAMLLMYEQLARVRMSETIDEATRYRRAQRLLAARRWRRRAERATRRARLAQNAIW